MQRLIGTIQGLVRLAGVWCWLLAMTGTAFAQAGPADGEWTRGSTLNAFVGLSRDGTQSAAAAGGAIGWEVTSRFALEGTAAWFDRGRSAEAFSADMTALVSLVSPRRVVPFVKGGFGVHRAWFDTIDSPIPNFYARRIEPTPIGRSASFSDPAVVMGVGLRIWLGEHVAIRPELDTRAVLHDGSAYWLNTAALRVAYFFGDRPTTDRTPRP